MRQYPPSTISVERALPSPPITLTATPLQMQTARIVARLRKQAHDARRRPEQDLGSHQANERADLWGIAGEYILIDALDRAGRKPEGYTLFAERTPNGPDFVMDGLRYQVKTVPFGTNYVAFNERQRLDPQKAFDYLLVVRFVSDKVAVVHAPVAASVVATWPLREKHSAYRSTDPAKLPLLHNWRELDALATRKEGRL